MGVRRRAPAMGTHTDELSRDNHARVARVNAMLRLCNIDTWFDAEKMCGDVNNAMAEGIKGSDRVFIFIGGCM